MEKLSLDKFLDDVKSHEMTIIHDSGVNRCIKFAKPNTIHLNFMIVTYENHLCITGDMGAFVFSRLPDMFRFFRAKIGAPQINPDYWGEKLCATDRWHGYEKYSPEKVRRNIEVYIQDAEYEELIKITFEEQIFPYLNEGANEVYQRINNLEFEFEADFDFRDLDCNASEHTYHYLWCCHAIVWGIAQYDAAKKAGE